MSDLAVGYAFVAAIAACPWLEATFSSDDCCFLAHLLSVVSHLALEADVEMKIGGFDERTRLFNRLALLDVLLFMSFCSYWNAGHCQPGDV